MNKRKDAIVYSAIPTPFNQDYTLDVVALERMLKKALTMVLKVSFCVETWASGVNMINPLNSKWLKLQ